METYHLLNNLVGQMKINNHSVLEQASSETTTNKLFEIKVFDDKMKLVGTATLNENDTDYRNF